MHSSGAHEYRARRSRLACGALALSATAACARSTPQRSAARACCRLSDAVLPFGLCYSARRPTLCAPTPHLRGGYQPACAAADGDTRHIRNLAILKSHEPPVVASHPCPLDGSGISGIPIEQGRVPAVFIGDHNLPGTPQCLSLRNSRVGRPKLRRPGIDAEHRAGGRCRCGRLLHPVLLALAFSPTKRVNGETCDGPGDDDCERG